jgi:prephenate dehydrogenase
VHGTDKPAGGWRERRVAVAGTGLIGGSILHSLHEQGLDVIGWDPSPAAAKLAKERELPFTSDLGAALAGRDLVYLAGPLPALPALLSQIVTSTKDDCLITDVGSTKATVALAGAGAQLTRRFIPGHPMAGSEKAGLASASATLLQECAWVLCPYSGVPMGGFRALTAFTIGAFAAKVVPMRPVTHDTAAAMASHIPHLLASTLAGSVARSPQRAAVLSLAAGSFRDGTRVAGTPSTRVTHMVTGNRAAVLRQLTQVRNFFDEILAALQAGDDDALLAQLTEAGGLREELLDQPLTPVSESFSTRSAAAAQAELDFLLHLGEGGGHLTGCAVTGSTVAYTGCQR